MLSGSDNDRLTTLDGGPRGSNENLEDALHSELDSILRRQRNQHIIGRGRDVNMRSGSAPPTVEGSLSAVGSLFTSSDFREVQDGSCNIGDGILSEDEIRSHPAYLSYYYSHNTINPRLPPPLLSKEDWRIAQRFQVGGSSLGGVEDRRRRMVVPEADNSSLFSMQPGLSVEYDLNELRKASVRDPSQLTSAERHETGTNRMAGLSGSGLGARKKSFADILQEGLDPPTSLSGTLSWPSSGDNTDAVVMSDHSAIGLCNGKESNEVLNSGAIPTHLFRSQSHLVSSVSSTLSRSTTPDQQLVGRSPSPGLPPVGSRVFPIDKKNVLNSKIENGHSSGISDFEIAAALSSLSVSHIRHANGDPLLPPQLQMEHDNERDFSFNSPNCLNQSLQQQPVDKSSSRITFSGQVNFPKRTSSSTNLYQKVHSSGFGSLEAPSNCYGNAYNPNMGFNGHTNDGYSVNQKMNLAIDGNLDTGSDGGQFRRMGIKLGHDQHSPVIDPRDFLSSRRISDCTSHDAGSLREALVRDSFGTLHGDLEGLQRAHHHALLVQQKRLYDMPYLGSPGGPNRVYYTNQSYGLDTGYIRNPIVNSVLSSAGSRAPMFQNERALRFGSMMGSSMCGSIRPGHSETGTNVDGRVPSSLLDEFKNNKTRSFELSDILDHVVDFSTDQYGSRFIQQKLETATVVEKTNIFSEIIPHARNLMIDVFGNYVIQKIFDHGTDSQIKELVNQLTGLVLSLSLQMYGCRVIQKALEVVDVDQQTLMVAELDGYVMKCVRDQNGNHVIQKCIECVPQDQIQFIISAFYGQVVALSTHPYGCRVIQRVLEHCADLNTQETVMDEILQSVCNLAQDQYGNYVIQHVLEKGKPHERSVIISKLAGQIVKMSRHKFASNVVEKCLTCGGPEERQLLVNEMLGSTDENEPLQAMMKDPYGNYVVQKVLETCDDQSLELIISRIKVHLNALKRYTYGKHIVSRVEKLIATGERRIGLSSSFSS